MDKFKEVLIKHKKLISQIGSLTEEELSLDKNVHKIIAAKKQARELSLAHSMCRCSKCGTDERLSFHHFILKPYKKYMDFGRWITSRTYWNNLLVLCWKCHKELHNINKDEEAKDETDIPEVFRNKVIKKYGINTTPFKPKEKQK